MAEDYKSYRIRTTVGGEENVLHVNLTQTYDTLEVLSLKIDQINSYKTYKSDYGVVIGRVFANGGYGVPNAKVSVFIPSENGDTMNENILYPFRTVKSLDNDNVRYNLLPDFVDAACHQNVGTFPNKRMVLDNDDIVEVFDKYYTYTTTTNNAGDYMIFGVPTGMNTIHMDVDLSDIGTLSQKPRDFLYKGYNIEQFDSPTKFKTSTNLSSLAQIMSEDKQVYVYPYWGDTSETDDDIAITRCDFELAYKIEPTCVFMGSVVTDTASNAISQRCTPSVGSGQMSELVAGNGTIEMIRKTFDNKVEQFAVNGNQNIDENGVWCYQIPMNLDYIVTDEFGNIVPSNDPEKGIPTRTRVRFRISLLEMEGDDKARNRCRYLVPNNPRFDDRFPEFSKSKTVDYEFGTMTRDEDYCDLFWNNVYTVKNYIPRLQTNSWVKNGSRHYGGIKMISHYGDNSPMPYNQVTTRMNFTYSFLCNIFKFIVDLVTILNYIISYVIGGIIAIVASPFCILKAGLGWIPGIGKIFSAPCNAISNLTPRCVGLSGTICGDYLTHNLYFTPGCEDISLLGMHLSKPWTNTKKDHYKDETEKINLGEMTNEERTTPTRKTDELRNCIETSLAEEHDVISFNFNNDWVNGMLYMPLWWRAIRPKRTYLFGLIKKKAEDNWCSSTLNFNNKILQAVQPCAVNVNNVNNGSSNGCGKKNEGCLTAKSVVGFRHGVVVNKKTMIGQDVYYYAACEVDTDSKQVDRTPQKEMNDKYSVKLLFATDIVLLGSLNDNDINGIPQFYKSLYNTTYNMPPSVLQTVNLFNAETDEDGDISYTQTSESEYTGRDWGNTNNDLCNDDDGSKDGGLFYGIGCGGTQMTPKSCINVSRICEFGVSLDGQMPVITNSINDNNDDLESVTDYIVPDGYISFDEINNPTQRSAFATLNGNLLRTILNNETGLKEYVFKYLDVDNFDGNLHDLMQNTQSKCSKNQRFNYYLEQKSEGYVNFRMGEKAYFYNKGNKTGNYFPRYENSFYFYFGLKEGKTALDKLNKYYVSDCADTIATEAPLKTISKGNGWCAFEESEKNGYVGFDLTAIDLPCTILLIGVNDKDGINQREFIANNDKVYISSVNFGDNGEPPLPEELNGYTRITKSVSGNNITMVDNDTYKIYVTDDNGEIITAMLTISPNRMECVITPTNFDTPFIRLMDRYNNIYKIMANREFETEPIQYTTNLTRKIGGTINISWPKDGDTNEPLSDFEITIKCNDETIGYNVRVRVCDGEIDRSYLETVFETYDALIYRPETAGEDGFLFGVPQGESTYVVDVRQLCFEEIGGMPMYIETNNNVHKTIFITDKKQFKLYINDVDYDVIKHWRTGFDVQNINSYYGTAKIYEEGSISEEWFHLTNSNNYHWYESNEYNKIDRALVDLVKAKHDAYLSITEDEIISALYDLLIGTIANDRDDGIPNGSFYDDVDYQVLINAENDINNYGRKHFLYYTAGNGKTVVNRNFAMLKEGLESEIRALSNNCIVETKEIVDYYDYKDLPEYGKTSYEKVYECFYDNTDYVSVEEFSELENYITKNITYYPYEFTNKTNGEKITYYGYVDMPEDWNDANPYRTLNEDKKSCEAYKYLNGCSVDDDANVVDARPLTEDFDKYIPYTYEIGNSESQCGTATVDGENRDVFVQPGYFKVKKWISVEDIDFEGSSIVNTTECDADSMIYRMTCLSRVYVTYLPYIGYNALQNSDINNDYEVSSYIKVVDVFQYYENLSKYVNSHGIYQYVRLQKGYGPGKIPYLYIEEGLGRNYLRRYNRNETVDISSVYFIDSIPHTISRAKLVAMNPDWFSDDDVESVWASSSRCYKITENGVEYLYVPQYAPFDKKMSNTYSSFDFEDLPTYGKMSYNVSEDEVKYRNVYIDDVDNPDYIKSKSEYENLKNNGTIDFQAHSYLPLKLVGSDTENYYDEINLCDSNCDSTEIFDYRLKNGGTDIIGNIISECAYEHIGILQEEYEPNRYVVANGDANKRDFDTGITEVSAEEYEEMSEYSNKFYHIFEYRYIIDEDNFDVEDNGLSVVAKRYFSQASDENGTYYIIVRTEEIPTDANDEYYILDSEIQDARVPKGIVREEPNYVNILDNTDILTMEEYEALSSYMKCEYKPYRYEERVGQFSIGDCEEEDNSSEISKYFEDIIALDVSMIDQLESAQEFRSDFINAAKETFWMTCTDKEHILTFNAVTDDKPVKYHLIYKQEISIEDENEDTTYTGLSPNDSYISDGTNDIAVTIPTICGKDDIEWGNDCHPIPLSGYENICFARDNSSGGCLPNITDAYYRKAFFVAVVNGKDEIIPYGTLDKKLVPSNFFGVHVLDKRFINNLIIWPYIKGLPLFTNNPQSVNTLPIEINMFGSIAGVIKNGVTEDEEKINGDFGYYVKFASQRVDGEYSYDLIIYTNNYTIDEDMVGITRYIIGEQDNEEQDIKTAISGIVQNIEGQTLDVDTLSIDTFKPFENYKLVDNITSNNTQKQCAILTDSQFDISIVDNNNCGVSQTINGNLEITLDSKSVNDLQTLQWGYVSNNTTETFVSGCDNTFLKVNLKNGDIDDFTFYAFEYSENNGSYPLNINNITLINDGLSDEHHVDYQKIYCLKGEEYNPLIEFENNSSYSKYLFGQSADPSFSVAEGATFNYVHLQDDDSQNERIFKEFVKYRLKYGNALSRIEGIIGNSKTTSLLYSVNEDVSFDNIIEQRNNSVRYIVEKFVSSEYRKSCGHAKDNWQFYNPQPQGQMMLNNEERELEEYIEYIGFSHTGEFALNGKMTPYFLTSHGAMWSTAVQIVTIDECEETDSGEAAVSKITSIGNITTNNSHKPFYIVAISDDGIRRAISPVYDFRIHTLTYQKVKIGDNLYYKINIANAENRYYFWHYEYMATFDINYGKIVNTTEDGQTVQRFVSDINVNGVLLHPSEKTNSTITVDSLIPIPNGGWGIGGNEKKIEGTITLTDWVGLKHKIRVDRNQNTINNEGEGTILNSYTFKTNGGVWKLYEGEDTMQYIIPEEYIGTSRDYIMVADNSNNKEAWKADLAKQLKREQFGVVYETNGWTEDVENRVFTIIWTYNGEEIGEDLYTIVWKWREGTVGINEYNQNYEIVAVKDTRVKLPNSIVPPRLVNISNSGTYQSTFEFTDKWSIPVVSGGNTLINSADYFVAGDEQYVWVDKKIELYADYTEQLPLTIYFIDNGINYETPNYDGSFDRFETQSNVVIDGITYPLAVKTTVGSGTNVSEFNNAYQHPRTLDNITNSYTLLGWLTDNGETIIERNNTIINGVWKYILNISVDSASIIYDDAEENSQDESWSITECYVTFKRGNTTIIHEMNLANMSGNYYVGSEEFGFSNNEVKKIPVLGKEDSNAPIKMGGIYITLQGGYANCCFFVDTNTSTKEFKNKTYVVCADDGCVREANGDNYIISFKERITPRQNG